MNEELQITKLSIEDIDSIMTLQEKNINHFKPEEQHFTIHRSKEDFIKTLTSDNQYMYGIYIGKTLVAQSILEFPKDGEYNYALDYHKGYKNSEVAIYKAVLVDPEYRGKGLMMRMLQAREDMAVMCGKKSAVCIVSADNTFSWSNVLKHGMQIMKVYESKDGHTKMLMQKQLNTAPKMFTNLKNKMIMSFNGNCPAIFINKMSMASKMGKIGIWDKEQKALAWVDNSSIVNPIYANSVEKMKFEKLTLVR